MVRGCCDRFTIRSFSLFLCQLLFLLGEKIFCVVAGPVFPRPNLVGPCVTARTHQIVNALLLLLMYYCEHVMPDVRVLQLAAILYLIYSCFVFRYIHRSSSPSCTKEILNEPVNMGGVLPSASRICQETALSPPGRQMFPLSLP